MTYRITKSYSFSAAHRLEGHPKCGRMHGHNYQVDITLEAETLDGMRMVLDFGIINELVAPLIDQLDHRYLVSNANLEAGCPYVDHAPPQDLAHLDVKQTTAEELAAYLFNSLFRMDQEGVTVTEVTVWETPKAKAAFSP